jgi:adenylate cyclase
MGSKQSKEKTKTGEEPSSERIKKYFRENPQPCRQKFFELALERIDFSRTGMVDLNLERLGLKTIALDDVKELQTLNLAFNNLENIPSLSGSSSSLEEVLLSGNFLLEITGLPPKMNSLLKLDLSFNWLKQFPFLNNNAFPVLKYLNLSHNPLTQTPDLSDLPHLEYLDLNCCGLLGCPSIGGVTSLLYLDISYNEISDFCSARSWPVLEALKLQSNKLTNEVLQGDHKFPRLKRLNLSRNLLHALPEFLTCGLSVPELSDLDLSLNLFATFPAPLLNLCSLSTLELNGTNISSVPSLASLSHLQCLSLRWNKLSSPPDSLWELKHLVALDLSGNDIPVLPTHVGS